MECIIDKNVMLLYGVSVCEHSQNEKMRLLQLMKHLWGGFLSSDHRFPRPEQGFLKELKEQQPAEES